MEDMKGDSLSNVSNSDRIAAMQACVDHARALLASARAVLGEGHPNIAYHLAALTLEEIGRRELMKVQLKCCTKTQAKLWSH